MIPELKPNLNSRGALIALLVALLIGLSSCSEAKSGASGTETPVSPAAAAAAPAAAAPAAPSAKSEAPTAPADTTPPAHVDGARAMQYTREVVAFGSRPVGSANHKKLEAYLRAHLSNDNLEEDAFSAATPAGTFPVRNFIAKFPGTKDGIIVIASHYDTNYPLKNYVGANDGGSTTGLLVELANHLRGKKLEGYSVWLVWFDAEEAVQQWSATDGLYGSRHLSEKWAKDGTLKKIKGFLLLDMIGDADLNVDRDLASTPWLEDLVRQAASRLGYQSFFYAREISIEDDHIPFAQRGVPVADLIDYEYGYNNVYHHTPDDTLDKLSPKSLEIVGSTVLEAIRLLNQR